VKFKWQGYDSAAKKVAGELEAGSPAEARTRLRQMNVRPLKLVQVGGNAPANKGGGLARPAIDWSDLSSLSAALSSPVPSLIEFAAFIRQLAVMQEAGIPIVTALGILADQAETPGFGRALGDIKNKVEAGLSFTEALRFHQNTFDRIFINLANAGEVSGSLDRILDRLAVYYEKSAQLRRKIIGAMTYPVLMLCLMVAVVTIMLMFVVPTFAEMFTSNGGELPEATQMVMAASDTLRDYWWAYFGFIGATVAGVITGIKSPGVRQVIDPALLRMPILGDILQKVAIARFARTFGTMIQSGVPILECLDICARVSGNYAVERALARTKEMVTQGNSVSAPLAQAKIFPKMAVSMITIGEQTGALDKMLNKIADFYEAEVDAKVSSITSIIEPFMIVLVGIVVAAVLIPMYLPIFKMSEVMSGGG
jgi:type IV pilus assembly protein PilC